MKTVSVVLGVFTALLAVLALVSSFSTGVFDPFNAYFYLGSTLFFLWLWLNPGIAKLSVHTQYPRIRSTRAWLLAPLGIAVMLCGSIWA